MGTVATPPLSLAAYSSAITDAACYFDRPGCIVHTSHNVTITPCAVVTSANNLFGNAVVTTLKRRICRVQPMPVDSAPRSGSTYRRE
jgi:hypothetical protein